jgi:hypothetical protein
VGGWGQLSSGYAYLHNTNVFYTPISACHALLSQFLLAKRIIEDPRKGLLYPFFLKGLGYEIEFKNG